MTDSIQIGDKWYISARVAHSDQRAQMIKHDGTFAVLDRFGDIRPFDSGDGLYERDTRFLSRQELLINGVRPLFLNCNLKDDSSLLTVELMNPDLVREGASPIPKGTLHIFRAKLLWSSACYEHIRIANFGLETVSFELRLNFAADYADIFEVRGSTRARRGRTLPVATNGSDVTLGYCGLDDIKRTTLIHFDRAPSVLGPDHAVFEIMLAPMGEWHLYSRVHCQTGAVAMPPAGYHEALRLSAAQRCAANRAQSQITTSNPLFNRWVERSVSDLAMLTTAQRDGPYPYAGVPWYSTTFGRDGILTARECLWLDPAIARGVLSFLAATQADAMHPQSDAEPGKILHEVRTGEMAILGEVPFGRYYGSVDATPLFVSLAGAYYARTGDLDFIRSIWDNIERALGWIDTYGDADRDGFVEYERRSTNGLDQQGWKDSQDSVFHADGTLAAPPIALCEVQAYVYEAKCEAAVLAKLLGRRDLAASLRSAAADLKRKFEQAFWCEDIGTYAIALDGSKRQCKVRSSNAGQVLWSNISSPQHAQRVIEGLREPDFYSGWGVRTIASGQSRYNPMSYHNGSVWPHDNALIAAGIAQYSHTADALKILAGLYDASLAFEQHRLPELFCGFPRRPAEGPTLYPVACSPQAWASGAVFMLIQASLGLEFDLARCEIRFNAPLLPDFIDWMQISNISFAGGCVDVMLRRYEKTVGVDVIRQSGNIGVVCASKPANESRYEKSATRRNM